MPLRAFEEAAITNVFTLTGDFSYSENSEADGDAGQTLTRLLYITFFQRLLSGGIDANQTSITLNLAWTADDGKNIAICENEKMLVTAGWGTTSITVIRGYHSTTKASHSDTTPFRSCYKALANEATVKAVDIEGTDQSGWVTYCLAPAGVPDESYSAELTLKAGGDIEPGETIIVERKIVVPASWDPEDKQDLIHRIEGTLKEYSP